MIKDLQATDPELAGPYRLLGRLGAGGMGQAYLGRSASGRLVAIKLIRAELADEPGFRARFGAIERQRHRRELLVRQLQRRRHPDLVPGLRRCGRAQEHGRTGRVLRPERVHW